MEKSNFEGLRKQARRLENEIDAKLIELCKECTKKHDIHLEHSLTKPLLADECSDQVEKTAVEIEYLLNQLKTINEQMSDIQISLPSISEHTLRRHNEILADYTSEFKKTLENYEVRKNKDNLLRTVHSDKKSASSGGLNRRMDLYLKENEHIRSSNRLVDEQISIAMETREELMSQRITMKKLHSRLNDVTSRFPIVNNLLHRINMRRRRDTCIIGLVIGLCTVLLLTYIFY